MQIPAAREKSPIVQIGAPEAPPQNMPLVTTNLEGRFVELDGEIFFSYLDSEQKRNIDVQFHPDAIFSITTIRAISEVST
jgi:hypothetical protein